MCLGIPAQIVELVDAEGGVAKAEISGVRREISVALCPEAKVGDWVLVHVGFALATMDEDPVAHAGLGAEGDGDLPPHSRDLGPGDAGLRVGKLDDLRRYP